MHETFATCPSVATCASYLCWLPVLATCTGYLCWLPVLATCAGYVGPLWGSERAARAEILREMSWEHCNHSTTGPTNVSFPSCRPSLGLGRSSQSRDPEGHVWGALKSQYHRPDQCFFSLATCPSVDPRPQISTKKKFHA